MLSIVVVASTGLGAPGCTRDYGRSVDTRISDVLYGPLAARPLSTAHYPRVEFDDDYRVVLRPVATSGAADTPPVAPDTTQIRAPIAIPENAVLKFEFGSLNIGTDTASTSFKVDLVTEDGGVHGIFEDVLEVPPNDNTAWVRAAVDLPRVEGTAQLIFETRATNPRTRAFFAEPVITVPATKQARPNVVLISLDTLRADHLGIYGYGRDTSPALDRCFTSEGAVVEHAYSAGADTILGHTAMLTGMNPTAALVGDPRFIQTDALVTLAESLRARGYRTAAMTENATLMPRQGFPRGFDAYCETKGGPHADPAGGEIEQTFERGLAWLRTRPHGPFFLFLHTYEVHFPYDPPQSYQSLFPTRVGAPKIERQRDDYDREIRYTDDRTAALIAEIDRLSPPRDTILIITSDHGEEFGDHGRHGHGSQLHEEIVGVPMLIRAKGRLPEGVRRQGPMALIDVMPTLLELLGIEVPDSTMGRSVLAHLRDGTALNAVPIFHEAHTPWAVTSEFRRDEDWLPPTFAVTEYPLRMIRIRTEKSYRYEMFNLELDPAESSNLYNVAYPNEAARLQSLLDGYFASAETYQADLVKNARTRANEKSYTLENEPDPERLEKLKALGYVNP